MSIFNGYIEAADLEDFSEGSANDFRRKHGDAVEDAHNMLGEKFVKKDGSNGVDKCGDDTHDNGNEIENNNSQVTHANNNNIIFLKEDGSILRVFTSYH